MNSFSFSIQGASKAKRLINQVFVVRAKGTPVGGMNAPMRFVMQNKHAPSMEACCNERCLLLLTGWLGLLERGEVPP